MMIKKVSLCLVSLALTLMIQSQISAGQLASSRRYAFNTSKTGKAGAHREFLLAQREHMHHGTPMKGMGDKEGKTGHEQSTHPERMTPRSALEPAEGAEVEILSPRPMQVFHGDEVALRYRLVKGKRANHVHAYIDGVLMGMFKRDDGTLIGEGTLTGIKTGRHTLELRAVTHDHKTELDAIDVVDFSVTSTAK